MKNKISFFLPSLDGGGAEKVFVTLANSLANRGYWIDFVLANAYGPYLQNLDNRINIINFQKKQVFSSLVDLGYYLKKQQPSVIISALSNANAATIISSKLFSVSSKIIITQHINWSQVLNNNPTKKEILIYHLSKFLYPYAYRIVGISKPITDEIKQIKNVDPRKVIQIYNPVLTSEMMDLSKQTVDHPWLINKYIPVLLAVGRLVEQKDFGTLIRAFHKVQSKLPSKLIILGEGPERQNLKKLVQDLDLSNSVDLPGFFPNPYSFMTAADLFVMSSLFEGLPTVLIEALACGIPVVATNCISGPEEILEGGKYGSLVPVKDVDALTQAIIEGLRNPIEKIKIQERSKIFSAEKATDEYISLIDSISERA